MNTRLFSEDLNVNSQEYQRMKLELNSLIYSNDKNTEIVNTYIKLKRLFKIVDGVAFWYLYLLLILDASILFIEFLNKITN